MNRLNHRYAGYLIGILGVVLFSAKAVMVKLAYQFDVNAVSLLLLRMLFALPFYLFIAIKDYQSIRSKLNQDILLGIVFFGFLGYYLASYFDFLGLMYIKASLERIILFIYPTLVLLISWVFLKRKVTKNQVVAILITYVGVIFIFVQDPDLGRGNNIGVGAGLIFLSALTYASYLVGSGYLIPKIGAKNFTSLAMIVSCIGVIFHYLLIGDFKLLEFDKEVYWLGLVMAIFSTVLPSYMVSYAIKMVGAPNFSILGSFGPVSTIVLAYVFLGEQVSVSQWFGIVVVVMGVYYISKK
ncbi:MAG: DMT family transporter [Reichenbachiella sp.]